MGENLCSNPFYAYMKFGNNFQLGADLINLSAYLRYKKAGCNKFSIFHFIRYKLDRSDILEKQMYIQGYR